MEYLPYLQILEVIFKGKPRARFELATFTLLLQAIPQIGTVCDTKVMLYLLSYRGLSAYKVCAQNARFF